MKEKEPTSLSLSPADKQILERIWRWMKMFKPGYYKVLRPWVECVQLRDEPTQYSHGVYRGWYAEVAEELRLSENAVKDRLRNAQKWFAKRITKELHYTRKDLT